MYKRQYVHLFIVFPSCVSGASNMEMFPILIGLREVRDGLPHLAGTVPLRTDSWVHALKSFLFLLVITGNRVLMY